MITMAINHHKCIIICTNHPKSDMCEWSMIILKIYNKWVNRSSAPPHVCWQSACTDEINDKYFHNHNQPAQNNTFNIFTMSHCQPVQISHSIFSEFTNMSLDVIRNMMMVTRMMIFLPISVRRLRLDDTEAVWFATVGCQCCYIRVETSETT